MTLFFGLIRFVEIVIGFFVFLAFGGTRAFCSFLSSERSLVTIERVSLSSNAYCLGSASGFSVPLSLSPPPPPPGEKVKAFNSIFIRRLHGNGRRK